MERRGFFSGVLAAGAAVWSAARAVKAALPSDGAAAAEAGYLALPGFEKNAAVSLDQALLARATSRDYAEDAKLPPEQLSRLLWAATGVNREDGHRTTPSAMAWYPVDLYVALAEGVFLYEPKAHRLKKIHDRDVRGEIPLQGNFKKAAMLALYVYDSSRVPMGKEGAWADLEIGCMVQNLYLKAAAEGLHSCVFALIKADKGGELLGLKKTQKLRIAQAVGPGKTK